MLPASYRKFDPSDMYGLIYRFPDQMEDAMKMGREIGPRRRYPDVTGLVLAGMGGSAIAADIASALISSGLEVPSVVVRDYRLPRWVGKETLVICLSYSGSTEETLSCLDDAVNRGALVAGITSGGELRERLIKSGHDVITVPAGYPPRAALGYMAVPLLYFLHRIGLARESLDSRLQGAAARLASDRDLFSRVEQKNPAFTIARRIYTTIPVIYGSGVITASAALRWRGQLEENGKMVAFHHLLPEMNHNEIVGYGNHPDLTGQMSLLWLMDADDHPRTRKRQTLSRRIIGRAVKRQIDIEAKGENSVERLFYLVHLGDWVSFWAAMHHGCDPTPVDKIEQLKLFLAGQK